MTLTVQNASAELRTALLEEVVALTAQMTANALMCDVEALTLAQFELQEALFILSTPEYPVLLEREYSSPRRVMDVHLRNADTMESTQSLYTRARNLINPIPVTAYPTAIFPLSGGGARVRFFHKQFSAVARSESVPVWGVSS